MGTAVRRAQALLGTVVEVGACKAQGDAGAAVTAALAEIARLQGLLSRFEPSSDISRFNALAAGASVDVHPQTAVVLEAAARLEALSEGRFDITQGRSPGCGVGRADQAWRVASGRLFKLQPETVLDLGGIAKGYIVDAAVAVLQTHGCDAGWVNAGGDLRTYGAAPLTLQLRDEATGGVRPWGRLRDGACATSHYAPTSRSRLNGAKGLVRHLSVLAPCCLWADGLTKIAAFDDQAPVLETLGATAVWH
jgi:thiamine biosynthesis lipoprotein